MYFQKNIKLKKIIIKPYKKKDKKIKKKSNKKRKKKLKKLKKKCNSYIYKIKKFYLKTYSKKKVKNYFSLKNPTTAVISSTANPLLSQISLAFWHNSLAQLSASKL